MGFLDFFRDSVRGSGYKPMRPREGSVVHVPSYTGALPPGVDLRPFMTSIEDQGETNSCAANAVAGAGEFLLKQRLGGDAYDLSRLFLYYNGRSREGGPIRDDGSVLQYVVEGFSDLGACPEPTWPFDENRVNRKPVEEAYQLAQRFRVPGAESMPIDAEAWKRTLASGNPIIFGTDLFESFDEASANGGFVPMPEPGAVGREKHGGHAMLCVGYSEMEHMFIVRNSWGPGWGVQGNCYMHENYLANPNLTNDAWVLRNPFGPLPAKLGWVMEGRPLGDRRYPGPVHAPDDYRDAGNFYDRPDWTVLAWAAVPIVYEAVKSLFFTPGAGVADWSESDLAEVAAVGEGAEEGEWTGSEDETFGVDKALAGADGDSVATEDEAGDATDAEEDETLTDDETEEDFEEEVSDEESEEELEEDGDEEEELEEADEMCGEDEDFENGGETEE